MGTLTVGAQKPSVTLRDFKPDILLVVEKSDCCLVRDQREVFTILSINKISRFARTLKV
jgi:hypothetical protein